jgi:hypothetical protein
MTELEAIKNYVWGYYGDYSYECMVIGIDDQVNILRFLKKRDKIVVKWCKEVMSEPYELTDALMDKPIGGRSISGRLGLRINFNASVMRIEALSDVYFNQIVMLPWFRFLHQPSDAKIVLMWIKNDLVHQLLFHNHYIDPPPRNVNDAISKCMWCKRCAKRNLGNYKDLHMRLFGHAKFI